MWRGRDLTLKRELHLFSPVPSEGPCPLIPSLLYTSKGNWRGGRKGHACLVSTLQIPEPSVVRPEGQGRGTTLDVRMKFWLD